MKPRLCVGYLMVMGVAIAAYAWAPESVWLRVTWQVGVGWLAAIATVVGVRRHRPVRSLAWLLCAAGVFLNATGILVEQLGIVLTGSDSYPTWADAFWLALYPCLAVGAALMIRRPAGTRDWSMTLDSTTITTGLGLLSWVFVIRPQAGDPTLSLLGHAVVAAYPVGDVVVLAILVRLLLGGGARIPAVRFLVGSLLTFLVGDTLWVVWFQLNISPSGMGENLMQMVFLVAFALVGAGALHPSVREVGHAVVTRDARLSPGMLAGLTIAALIAPIVLIVQTVSGHITDGVAIGISCTVLFVLVVTRMAGLLARVESQARQLRELARVDALTGLPNRRTLASELPIAVERARRSAVPLSVAMIDLDHFKRFNDEFGHPAGDRLLKGAAAAWTEKLRTVDLLARYGGEEFIALLPDATGDAAAMVIDRLRAVTPANQTFSAGVATWDGVEDSDELIARADAALYQAKQAGRSRTTLAAPTAGGQGVAV